MKNIDVQMLIATTAALIVVGILFVLQIGIINNRIDSLESKVNLMESKIKSLKVVKE